MYHYQTLSVRILDMPSIFCCYTLINKNKQDGFSNVLRHLKLNLSEKMQTLKYWLTTNYSKYIIWGHSVIVLPQNDENLDTPSTLVCTCLILILFFDSYLLQSASVNTTKNIHVTVFVIESNTDGIN